MELEDRAKVCVNLANESINLMEEKIAEIAKTLNNSMEVSHFLTSFENRLAILIHTKMNTAKSGRPKESILGDETS